MARPKRCKKTRKARSNRQRSERHREPVAAASRSARRSTTRAQRNVGARQELLDAPNGGQRPAGSGNGGPHGGGPGNGRPGKARDSVLERPLEGVWGRLVTKDGALGPDLIIRFDEIFYLGIGRENLGDIVHAKWTELVPVAKGRIFLQTDFGVFDSRLRGLTNAHERLPAQFERIHQSLICNLGRIRWSELSGQTQSRVGFARVVLGEPIVLGDGLVVSRRHVPTVRDRLGYH